SPGGTVWVTGTYKAGKSSLVNALVGDAVCPVDDDAPSTVLTVVREGAPRAVLRRQRGPSVQDQEIGTGDVAAFALHSGNPGNIRGVETLELYAPVPERLHGFAFVDTPTASSLGTGVAAVCLGFPASVGVVLHVVRAGVLLEEEELA